MSGYGRLGGVARFSLVLGLVAVPAGILAWLWRDNDSIHAPLRGEPVVRPQPPDTVAAANERHHQHQLQREAAPTTTDDHRVTIRFDGLTPSTPWTSDLEIQFHGYSAPGEQHWIEQQLTVNRDGTARFEPPGQLDSLRRCSFTIEGRDPSYRPIYHHSKEPITHGQEIVIEVDPVTLLRGRVVEADGKPVVAAQVRAIVRRGRRFSTSVEATTTTGQDGCFHMEVGSRQHHMIIAAAMRPVRLNPGTYLLADGGIANDGTLRTDLLPAWLDQARVEPVDGQLPDLVLQPAVEIRGVLRWSNGDPIPNAWVSTWNERTFYGGLLSSMVALTDRWHNEPGLLPATVTNELGEFTFPARPGQRLRVQRVHLDGMLASVPIAAVSEPAPGRLDLTVPDVTVRVVRDGRPVKWARLMLSGNTYHVTGEDGLARIPTVYWGIRASREEYSSRWVLRDELEATTGILDLELEHQRTPVTLNFGDLRGIGRVGVYWQEGPGNRANMRSSFPAIAPLLLPRGPLTLWVGGSNGIALGKMMVRTPHQIVVGTEPLELAIEPVFGGRLFLGVAAAEQPTAGTFRLFDAQGNVVRGGFKATSQSGDVVTGPPGTFAATAPQLFDYPLAGGDYVIAIAAATRSGTVHERHEFTIVPREDTYVTIDLP